MFKCKRGANMKIIGLLVLLIAVSSIAIFGMGALSDMTESSDESINSSSDMYESYESSKKVVSTSFGFIGFAPYLIGLALTMAIMMLLASFAVKY